MKKSLFWLLAGLLLTGAYCYLALAGQRSDAELTGEARRVAAAYHGQAGQARYVALVDYSRSILARRLTVVDTRGLGSIVLRSRVSHAWNSGILYATHFSNTPDSKYSSQGVFLTQEAYVGSLGYAMRLRGLDAGLNTNARSRAIVFHPGYFYSAGCFMTTPAVNKRLVDLLKDGSLVAVLR